MGTFAVDSREQKLFNLIIRLKPYKTTKIVFSQSGADKPVVDTIISNELELNLDSANIARTDAGQYVLNISNLGDIQSNQKIICNCGILQTDDPANILHCYKSGINEILLKSINVLIISNTEVNGYFWFELIEYN